jgi:imidazolonepropionase
MTGRPNLTVLGKGRGYWDLGFYYLIPNTKYNKRLRQMAYGPIPKLIVKHKSMQHLIGPFHEILTMHNLPLKGSLSDDQLPVIRHGGILIDQDGYIRGIGPFNDLRRDHPDAKVDRVEGDWVALPGLIDAHTHLCWGGSRARDYSLRVSGVSYQEIAARGGGIRDTVAQTRKAGDETLLQSTVARANQLLRKGITTIEVKSGYGQSVAEELRLLRIIRDAALKTKASIVPTALPAHIIPSDTRPEAYLDTLYRDFFPLIKAENLTNRADIFVDEHAYGTTLARAYAKKVRALGFDLTIHADQFSSGGSEIAVEAEAVSADHLEASNAKDMQRLAHSNTVATVLPGASLGLGIPFAPARKLLDADCCLGIASDWNPGSGPMGDLLTQAALLGAYEKLSHAEVFAGITTRAARALRLIDRGMLVEGMWADVAAFPTADFREILYHQGQLQPGAVWKSGRRITT